MTNPSPMLARASASNVKVKRPISNQEASGSVKSALISEAQASKSESRPEKIDVSEEGCSIYLRNLPQSATTAQLEEVFTKSGPIKQGGIQVRTNKQGICFGFVEFESLSSVKSAIQFWQLSDRGSDSNSYCSESDVQDSMPIFNYTGRNYADALLSSESSRKQVSRMVDGDELPQLLLESLFDMPKSAEHEPSTMNWRNVVKQMESFAQKRVKLVSDSLPQQMITQAVAKGAEYQVFRGTARQQWDKTRICYHKAATAYSNGEKNYATYMSEQGKLHSKMAQEADEKASMEIFKARNKAIENSLTIDLHGQHVKQAMRVVKLHLLFATYISSVQYIRIITGCGSRCLEKSVVKQSVINLLTKERVPWREENQGTVLIKLDGPREFSFLDSESDSDNE